MPIILTHNPPDGDLFPKLATADRTATPVKVKRAPRRPATIGWEITPHVCLACFGRVLLRTSIPVGTSDPVVTVICSNCGVTAEGQPQAICWCGHKQKANGGVQRFKCRVNENPTPEFPSEIEVVELR